MKSAAAAVFVLIAVMALAPAAFAASVWDDTDIVHWRVWKPGKHALVMIKATDTGMQLSAALEGLTANAGYRIIGTDGAGNCTSAVNSSNRTFAFDVIAGPAQGDTFFVGTASGGIWKPTEFIRIERVGGGTWACAAAQHFTVGPEIHDLAVSSFVFADGSVRGIVSVEQLANGNERLSVAVGDFNNDGPIDIAVRGNTRACGRSGGSNIFDLRLDDVMGSRFASRTINISQAKLDSLRSFRVRTLIGSQGQDWFGACRQSILVALLVP